MSERDLIEMQLGLGTDWDALAEDVDEDLAKEPLYSNEQIIEAAFAHFRKTGFPYRRKPLFTALQAVNRLNRMATESLWSTGIGYQEADSYHPNRFSAHAAGMKSPLEAFDNDDLLRRALRLHLEQGELLEDRLPTKLQIVSGTQACSNFRPGAALAVYRTYGEGGRILDTSMGYGGRLFAFAAWPEGTTYVGIDPAQRQCIGNSLMANDLGIHDRCLFIQRPAEEVDPDWVGEVDLCFTSPPYFAKEHYTEDDTQSWKRYPEPAAWREGFLEPMMALQAACLRPGGYAVVNIAPVKLDGTMHDLSAWTLNAGMKAGLLPEPTEVLFRLQKRMGRGTTGEVSTEPVIIFRKPDWNRTEEALGG